MWLFLAYMGFFLLCVVVGVILGALAYAGWVKFGEWAESRVPGESEEVREARVAREAAEEFERSVRRLGGRHGRG
jgi:hypothetical protein